MRAGSEGPIAVLGAGPAVLTAGYVLARVRLPVVACEAGAQVGGLGRTVVRDGYRFDLGGHRFFTKSDEVQRLWHEVLGDELLVRARGCRGSSGGGAHRLPAALARRRAQGRADRARALRGVLRRRERGAVPDPECTCVALEYFCFEGDELWSSSDDELVARATRELAQTASRMPRACGRGTVVRVPKAYPIYDAQYEARVHTIRDWLVRISNLQQVGRNGLHRYNTTTRCSRPCARSRTSAPACATTSGR
jgi:protoporphyrinogen oxidase